MADEESPVTEALMTLEKEGKLMRISWTKAKKTSVERWKAWKQEVETAVEQADVAMTANKKEVTRLEKELKKAEAQKKTDQVMLLNGKIRELTAEQERLTGENQAKADALAAAEAELKKFQQEKPKGVNSTIQALTQAEVWYRKNKTFAAYKALQKKTQMLLTANLVLLQRCTAIPAPILEPRILALKKLGKQSTMVFNSLKSAFEQDVGRALAESEEETRAVDKKKMVPPITLISVDLARVLKDMKIPKEVEGGISLTGKLEVIIGDAKIRREFATEDIDVRALAKLTEAAGYKVLVEEVQASVKSILTDMQRNGLTSEGAKTRLRRATEEAVEHARERALEEAERMTGIQNLVSVTQMALKVAVGTFKLVSAGLLTAMGAVTGNILALCEGIYNGYKAVVAICRDIMVYAQDVKTTLAEIGATIKNLEARYRSKGEAYFKEAGAAAFNEAVGIPWADTLSELENKVLLGKKKLSSMDGNASSMSKNLDGMLKKQQQMDAQIAKLQSQRDLNPKQVKLATTLQAKATELATKIQAQIDKIIDMDKLVTESVPAFQQYDKDIVGLKRNMNPLWADVIAFITGMGVEKVVGFQDGVIKACAWAVGLDGAYKSLTDGISQVAGELQSTVT